MIVINKEDVSTILVLTQIDKDYTVYKLQLHSAYTKSDYTIQLGDNYSQYNSRYTKFLVDNVEFASLTSGEYEYKFLADDVEITFGLLLLKSTSDKVVYESAIPAVEDNDFYVLKTN